MSKNNANVEKEFLMKLFEQNFLNARHVENQRLMFTSICSVFIGSTSILIHINIKSLFHSLMLLGLLLAVVIIFAGLTLRWNSVFFRHNFIAKTIAEKLFNNNDTNLIEKYYQFPEENIVTARTLYCFYSSFLITFVLYIAFAKYANCSCMKMNYLNGTIVLVITITVFILIGVLLIKLNKKKCS